VSRVSNPTKKVLPLTTLAVLAAAALPAAAPAASARVVTCSSYADEPNLLISSARGLSCASATSVMKAYRGDISYRFKAPRGFTCTRVHGVATGGQWRCVNGTRAFRFEFKD
jgi:hypothetical protein